MTIARGKIETIGGAGEISVSIATQDWKTSEKFHIGPCTLVIDSLDHVFYGEIMTIYRDYTIQISIDYWILDQERMHRGECTIYQDEGEKKP